jgi:hypothetical protein
MGSAREGPTRGEVRVDRRTLVGSGDRIGLFARVRDRRLVLNVAFPSFFDVGGRSPALQVIFDRLPDRRVRDLDLVGRPDLDEGSARES